MQNSYSNENYAGFWVRLAAYVIDSVIVAIGLLVVRLAWIGIGALISGTILDENVLFHYSLKDIVLYIFKVMYFALLTWCTGTTIGKRLMNLRVVPADRNEKLSFVDVLYRETVGRFLCGISIWIGYIIVGIDKEKRGFHDMLCDTRVVYEKKAKRIASDHNVDVTICDVNLPDGNGLEFVRWMRCNYNTYIICLTALDQEMDQVMGYEAGADDYITKPFSLSVLLLKIEAHFRRRQEKTEAGKMISGDIVFIAGEMKVLIKSREISLTKTELKMLTFFLQNPKKILSKTQILENVFDLEGDFVDENTIAVNIRRLREKIEDNPAAPVYIKNIRGLGYIWNQEVRQ